MRISFLVLFISQTTISVGQSRIDLTSFTLGLVRDYSGRVIIKADKLEETKIDQFHEFESDLMDFMDSLIDEENKFRSKEDLITKKRVRRNEANCTNCREFFNYYAKELAKDLNKKYRIKFDHSWDDKGRKIYRGDIKYSALKTENQRLSFLSGAYIRAGTTDNDSFIYNLANSYRQFNLILKSLRNLDCKIIDIKVVNGMPTNQNIIFVPSDKLRMELVKYDGLKRKIEKRYNETFKNGE